MATLPPAVANPKTVPKGAVTLGPRASVEILRIGRRRISSRPTRRTWRREGGGGDEGDGSGGAAVRSLLVFMVYLFKTTILPNAEKDLLIDNSALVAQC
jgi:hypothetical protein